MFARQSNFDVDTWKSGDYVLRRRAGGAGGRGAGTSAETNLVSLSFIPVDLFLRNYKFSLLVYGVSG